MNQTISPPELKKFGLIWGGLVSGIFGLVLPFLRHYPIPRWPWAVGIFVILWALLSPGTFTWFYRGWLKLGHILGLINTRIILAIIYYGMITPIGLVLKLMGHDPLRLRSDHGLETYRIGSEKNSRDRMEVPF